MTTNVKELDSATHEQIKALCAKGDQFAETHAFEQAVAEYNKAWMLIPDQIDDEHRTPGRLGVFGATVVAFFLAEMGDKTQIATVALAARYTGLVAVVLGTTLGMMLANVPAVLFGDRLARRVSLAWVHGIAAAVFATLGMLTLLGVGRLF